MKRYLLVFIALMLTAAVVTASVLNTGQKTATKKVAKKECTYFKSHCPRTSGAASY
jgi:hypothetical protein